MAKIAAAAAGGGSYYIAALLADGTVRALYSCSETEDCDKLDLDDWTGIVDVACGEQGIVGLRADGTCRVTEHFGPTADPAAWQGVTRLWGCDGIISAATEDGGVLTEEHYVAPGYFWPSGTEAGRVVGCASGYEFRAPLLSDGRIVPFGPEPPKGFSRLANCPDPFVQVAGCEETCIGLTRDGRVVAAHALSKSLDEASDWCDLVSVAAGSRHVCGLRRDGTVVACGENKQGQCNVGTWREIVALAAGERMTVGVRGDGVLCHNVWTRNAGIFADSYDPLPHGVADADLRVF